MIKLSVKTRLSPQEAIKQAVAFFGPGGYGLKITEQTDSCANFEGGGGMVNVTCSIEGKATSLEMESREWDRQLQEFVEKIK